LFKTVRFGILNLAIVIDLSFGFWLLYFIYELPFVF
jgi:hypothetical protein